MARVASAKKCENVSESSQVVVAIGEGQKQQSEENSGRECA